MKRRYLRAPRHVSAADLGPVTVLVNYRTGDVHTLTPHQAAWWTELAGSGDPAASLTLDPYDARDLRDDLQAAGLLVPTWRGRPWDAPVTGPAWRPSWGTQETAAGYTDSPRTPRRTTVAACLALLAVLALLGLSAERKRMARVVRLLTLISLWTRHDARPDHARRAVHAVRRVGSVLPGRVNCLEESAAVVVLLAASRQRVTWCHGVAADPVRLHAWVEDAEGEPVDEPETIDAYAVLRTIPARDREG